MSTRAGFLRQALGLVATAAIAPVALAATPIEEDDHLDIFTLKDLIEHHSGGFRPDRVNVAKLKRTGTAHKYRLYVRLDGRNYHKTLAFSAGVVAAEGFPTSAKYKSQLAYHLSKRAIEAARDIAYEKYGSDWRLKIEQYKQWEYQRMKYWHELRTY